MSNPLKPTTVTPALRGTAREARAASGDSFLLILASLGSLLAVWPSMSSAISVEVKQKPGSNPTIVVQTKPGERSYSVVQTQKIPVLLNTKGRCNEGDRLYRADLKLAGQRIDVDVDENHNSYSPDSGNAWRTHQFDLPVAALKLATGGKPLAENASRPQLSAIAMCNQELSKRQGSAREQMLSQGAKLLAGSGLTADFTLECSYRKGPKAGFHEYFPSGDPKTVHGSAAVIVHCAPMIVAGTPQPRTQTHTKGPPPRQGKPLPPAIEEVKLRAEISDQQACPDSVRLVGSITARAPSHGDYIFIGNQYLSAKSRYDFDGKGHRSVLAVRKLNWGAVRSLAAGPGAQRTLQGWAQLNVQPQGTGKVYSSEKVMFRATCRAPTPAKAATVMLSPDQPSR